jgi:Family of unknown function (DUF6404)
MTNDEKIAYFLMDMRKRNGGDWRARWKAAPPIYRLLWRLGVKVRPPLFASFWSLSVPLAVYCGIILLIAWWLRDAHTITGLVISVVGAASIGVTNAVSCRRQARKLALPLWEDYPARAIRLVL